MAIDTDRALKSLKKRRYGGVDGYDQDGNKLEKTAMSFMNGFAKAADVSKEELRTELKRHEERETPAQEAAESKGEQEVERRAGVEKASAELDSEGRGALPESDFVFPKERKFPIHDRAHARNALARAHFASDPGRVRAAVHAKYPDLGAEKTALFGLGKKDHAKGHQEAVDTYHNVVREMGEDTGVPLPHEHFHPHGMTPEEHHTGLHGYNHFSDKFNAFLDTPAGETWNNAQAAKHREREKTAFFAGFAKAATTYSLPHGADVAKAQDLLRRFAGKAKK